MKSKGTIILLFLSVLALGISSCGNDDNEKRIAELEDRLAQLEKQAGSNQPAATNPSSTPASQSNDPNVKPDGPLPTFSFDEMSYDFGTITEGDVVTHTFKFTNEGEAPLIIEKAQATCGCTVPRWTREPVPVGEDGEIQVRFDSKNKTGVQNKTVTITANTYPPITRLRIKSFVEKKTESTETADGPVRK